MRANARKFSIYHSLLSHPNKPGLLIVFVKKRDASDDENNIHII